MIAQEPFEQVTGDTGGSGPLQQVRLHGEFGVFVHTRHLGVEHGLQPVHGILPGREAAASPGTASPTIGGQVHRISPAAVPGIIGQLRTVRTQLLTRRVLAPATPVDRPRPNSLAMPVISSHSPGRRCCLHDCPGQPTRSRIESEVLAHWGGAQCAGECAGASRGSGTPVLAGDHERVARSRRVVILRNPRHARPIGRTHRTPRLPPLAGHTLIMPS